MDPKKLKRWLIAAGVLYLVFPRDLIPDFAGRGIGLIDDLLVLALLATFYRRQLREYASRLGRAGRKRASRDDAGRAGRERREREPGGDPGRSGPGRSAAPPDPYQILGVPRGASAGEIRAAYRARMAEYHPDKVAHLGAELQQLAHRKALEIQDAYRALSAAR